MNKTFVLLKPEALGKSIASRVMQMMLDKGFKIEKLSKVLVKRHLIEDHYAEHKGKDFFKPLTDRFVDQNVFAMEVHGTGDVVTQIRELVGATDPRNAGEETIRGKYGWVEDNTIYNIIHASDSPEAVERETSIWIG